MSAIAEREQASQGFARAAAPWRVERVSLASIADAWRALEGEGLATPYQRHEWVAAYAAEAMASEGDDLRVVHVQGQGGRTVAILPFVVRRRFGLAIAGFPGGKHANFQMGVFDRGFCAGLDAGAAEALLAEAGRAIGADAFMLHNQPLSWEGIANPFASLKAQPSPSQAYRLPLQRDPDATLQAAMSSSARKKHKNKRARFAELGASRSFVARTPEEKEAVLAAFFSQKARRFAQMGVADPFAEPSVRAFIRAASAGDGPAVTLHALELEGRIVAVYVGAVHGGRFSGMATSFEPDPAIMKVSPGEILLVDIIRGEAARGLSMFDLGVGEARYKTTICSETEELADSFVGVSPLGRAAAEAARLAGRAKRTLKASPLAFGLLQRARALRARLRPQQADAPRD